jgi:uncharacterized protein
MTVALGDCCLHGYAEGMDASLVYNNKQVAELATAAQDGDVARVLELATHGVDVNAKGDKGVNLLQWALLHKSAEGLDALLGAGANPALAADGGQTVLHFAALADDSQYLDVLLQHGVDVDTPNPETGETALASALYADREVQFRKLLAAGANPNHRDHAMNTPLHVAAKVNDPARALALLDAGADPKAVNSQGVTFQRYLNQTPTAFQTEEAASKREAVRAWLLAHGVAVEPAPAEAGA